MVRTAYQKICEVIRFRAYILTTQPAANATPKALAAKYAENARMSKGSEAVTESFLGMAFAIQTTLFNNTKILEALRSLEDNLGMDNPLNSITKLFSIQKLSRSKEDMEWVVIALHDHIMAGVYTQVGLASRDLGTSGKALVGIYLLRRRFLAFLLSKADVHFGQGVASVLREVFGSHETYRRRYRASKGAPEPDLSYQSSWPQSVRVFANFLEDTVYKHEHPFVPCFSNAAKAGKGVAELMSYQVIEEAWKTTMSILEDEQNQAKVAAKIGERKTLHRGCFATA
jgi:hypothetical protein